MQIFGITPSRRPSREWRRGFTLVEIMLVVVIIGLLTATVFPILAGRVGKARITQVRSQISAFENALQLYEVNVGQFPSTDQGLRALVECPSDVDKESWEKPYLKSIPKDAWGSDYVYRSPGEHNEDFDLYSKGKDKQEETDDDIGNWVVEEE